MNNFLSFLFLFLILTGCQNRPDCNVNDRVLKENDSILLDVKVKKSFSIFLNKMKEPELRSFGGESYRFIIRGPFGDNEIYRVSKGSDGYVISSKRYLGHFDKNYNWEETAIDSLTDEKKSLIDASKWKEFKKNIDQLNFWTLPVKINDNHYLDGTSYLIESYNSKGNECTNRFYHATVRISPNDTTLYKSLFKRVQKLSSE